MEEKGRSADGVEIALVVGVMEDERDSRKVVREVIVVCFHGYGWNDNVC